LIGERHVVAPEATRAMASGDPLTTLVATGEPLRREQAAVAAATKGAMLPSSGRSKVNWRPIGG